MGAPLSAIVADLKSHGCDLNKYFIMNYNTKTAMLRSQDSSLAFESDPACPVPESTLREGEENFRRIYLNRQINDDLITSTWDAGTYVSRNNFLHALHSNVASMFRSIFAIPVSNFQEEENRFVALSRHDKVIREQALGDYRTLARAMFRSEALQESLNRRDPLEMTDSCTPNFDENWAREWFELFMFGNKPHNENDVKIL